MLNKKSAGTVMQEITRIFNFEVQYISAKSSKFFILEINSPYGTAIPGGRIREIRFFGLRTLPIAIATNVHGAVTKQSLRSVDIPAAVLSTLSQLASGRPFAEKRTIHGSHILGTAGGPSEAK